MARYERSTRMYNAGLRIVDRLIYSVDSGHDIHCVASWPLDAPADDFFEVPDQLPVADMRISVTFVETILRRFEDRGVIAIAPTYKPQPDDESELLIPWANSDKEASRKGKLRWKSYYTSVARAHIEQCQQCRAANMPPLAASGFTRKALELAGLADPADAFMAAAQNRNKEAGEAADRLNALLNDPEKFKKLMAVVEKM